MREALLPNGQPASTSRALIFQTLAVGGRGRTLAIPRRDAGAVVATGKSLDNLTVGFSQFDAALAQRLASATNDDQRSAIGEWAASERARLRGEVRKVLEMAETDAAAAETRKANLLAPPAVNSPTAAILDQQARDAWGRLTDDQRQRMRGVLDDGKHDDLLLALARHPLPDYDPDALHARGLWAARMEKLHAADIAAADAQLRGAEAIAAGAQSLDNALAL